MKEQCDIMERSTKELIKEVLNLFKLGLYDKEEYEEILTDEYVKRC